MHTHFVKDEPLRLYGFADAAERTLFQTLIGVQGVGPRVALAILAGIQPSELVRAIATGDVGRLTQVKGVGRKIAERLALELREKILTVPAGKAAALEAPPPGARRRPDRWATSTARWCSWATSRPRSSRCWSGWIRPDPCPTWCVKRWARLRRQ